MTDEKSDYTSPNELSALELRRIQLTILDGLVEYCCEHGLRIYLAFGSLLGAVRHRGYIPWDDDIDVMMPRADYSALCAARTDIGAAVIRSSVTEPLWPFTFAKMMDTRTELFEKSTLKVDLGVGIDIFPLDGVPSQRWLRRLVVLTQNGLGLLLAGQAIERSDDRPLGKRALLAALQLLLRRVDRHWLRNARERLASQHPFDASQHVGVLVSERVWTVPSTAFAQTVAASFEGRDMPVPIGYEAVLSSTYGDYLLLPADSDRRTHHAFRAFWRG